MEWIKITDDKSTWPDLGCNVFVCWAFNDNVDLGEYEYYRNRVEPGYLGTFGFRCSVFRCSVCDEKGTEEYLYPIRPTHYMLPECSEDKQDTFTIQKKEVVDV